MPRLIFLKLTPMVTISDTQDDPENASEVLCQIGKASVINEGVKKGRDREIAPTGDGFGCVR